MSPIKPPVNPRDDQEIPVQSLEDVAPSAFAKGFANISGIHPSISRSISQRVRLLLKDEDEFKAYVMQARMHHLMIQDYMARNAPDSEDRKKAAETFLKLSDAMTRKPRRPAVKR